MFSDFTLHSTNPVHFHFIGLMVKLETLILIPPVSSKLHPLSVIVSCMYDAIVVEINHNVCSSSCPQDSLLFFFLKLLAVIFNLFDVVSCGPVHICSVTYKRKNKFKCQLLNSLTGEANVAIYLTRRDRLQLRLDVVVLWRHNIFFLQQQDV